MATEANCVLWNRAELNNPPSDIGGNGTDHGAPTYLPAQFGNGLNLDAATEGLTFVDNVAYWGNGGCFRCWIKPVGWSIANGAASANNHMLWDNRVAGNADIFSLWIQPAGFVWYVRSATVWTGYGVGAFGIPGMNSADGDWHALAVNWDTLGIGVTGNTQQVWWDGVELSNSANALTMQVAAHPVWTVGNLADLAVWDWEGMVDNIQIFNAAQEDQTDWDVEGFPAPPPVPSVRVPEIPALRRPTVTVGGIDISRFVGETPRILEDRRSKNNALFPDDARIRCRNATNLFSLGHPRSIFAGRQWQDERVVVLDRWGVKVWDGLLASPEVDHPMRETTIVSRSPLSRWKNEPVVYSSLVGPSGGDESPAVAFENICAGLGFTDFDTAALNKSKALQADMKIRVTLTAADNMTFAQAISTLCIYGGADAYEHLGKIVFAAWEAPSTATPSIIIDETDILDDPKTTRTTEGLVNDYAIYESSGGGSTVTDFGAGNIGAASRAANGSMILKDISGDANVIWDVRDAATARAIGENWIRRTHSDDALTLPRITTELRVRSEYRSWVDLTTDFGLTYSREAWVEKRFRVVAFTRDDEAREFTLSVMEW